MEKPTNSGTDNPDIKAIEMIRTSGVLNPHATLDQIMELTSKMSSEASMPLDAEGLAVAAKHTDTFIHSHFIYKHES